jgi:cytochrome P450
VPEDAIGIGGVDLTDPDIFVKGMPYEAFRELRRRPRRMAPVQGGPGFLALTGYDEILAVSRDSATWSSQETGVFYDIPLPEDAYQLSLMMLTMDPPRHTKLRSLVSKGFTPRQVARLNNHIADMARQIVDDVVERGECDFVEDIAGALPSYVIAELLGIPLADGRRLYELTEIMNTGVVGDPVAKEAQMQMFVYANELAARKRTDPATTSRPRCCTQKWTVKASPTSSSTCSSCC